MASAWPSTIGVAASTPGTAQNIFRQRVIAGKLPAGGEGADMAVEAQDAAQQLHAEAARMTDITMIRVATPSAMPMKHLNQAMTLMKPSARRARR